MEAGFSQIQSYILKGIEQGFRIGVNSTYNLISATKNMCSAALNSQVIDEYIKQESEAGNIIGPLLFHILSYYPLSIVRSYADITRPPWS